MKLWDIVKTVGTGLISATVPGAGLLIGAVNEFLPEAAKLPANATGVQMQGAIDSLPPESRKQLMEKEFDVEITQIKESNQTVRAMLESDAQNPQSTRPYIAKHSFHVVAFTVVMTVCLWSYGIYTADTDMVKTITDGWPFLLAAIGPLVVLLQAYFGVLKQEHKQKLEAAGGNPQPSGLAALVSGLVNRK